MQQSERQQQSWRVHVTAKANNFNFRLRFAAATHKPTYNFSFFRLSILLNLPKFAFKFNSQPTTHGPGFFTNRFIKFFHKLRPRLPKKKQPNNVPYLKDPIRMGFLVMGFLACVAQSIYKNNGRREIVKLASVGSLLILLRKLKMAKVMNIVRFFLVVVGTILCYLLFNFDYSNYNYNYNYNYWEYIGRSWHKMVNL